MVMPSEPQIPWAQDILYARLLSCSQRILFRQSRILSLGAVSTVKMS